MSLNDGFSKTFIFVIEGNIFKAVINFTKGMFTVYSSNGKILVRKEKLSPKDMKKIQEQVNEFIDGKLKFPDFSHLKRGFGIV